MKPKTRVKKDIWLGISFHIFLILILLISISSDFWSNIWWNSFNDLKNNMEKCPKSKEITSKKWNPRVFRFRKWFTSFIFLIIFIWWNLIVDIKRRLLRTFFKIYFEIIPERISKRTSFQLSSTSFRNKNKITYDLLRWWKSWSLWCTSIKSSKIRGM